MNYVIEGGPLNGYIVTFSKVWGEVALCPCCGKPIDTLRKAFLLAENLIVLAKASPLGPRE